MFSFFPFPPFIEGAAIIAEVFYGKASDDSKIVDLMRFKEDVGVNDACNIFVELFTI